MATTSTHRSEPIERRWTPDPSGLLELWQHEATRTLRTFRVFTDADLPFRPQPAERSIAELLQHIIRSYWLTRQWLIFDSTDEMPATALPRSVAEAVELLREAQAGLFAGLKELPPVRFRRQLPKLQSNVSGAAMLAVLATYNMAPTISNPS